MGTQWNFNTNYDLTYDNKIPCQPKIQITECLQKTDNLNVTTLSKIASKAYRHSLIL